jgi:NADH pyrophosphatase NudC (nudix superfamily)
MLDVMMSTIEEIRFCPVCREELLGEIIGGEPRKACRSSACSYVFWNNPTPVLAAIAHRDNEVVLVQGIGWPKHWYSLITGFHEAGESAEEGVLREVKEEIGIEGKIGSLVGVYSFFQMNQVIIAYEVLLDRGEITLDETELVDYKVVPTSKIKTWPSGTGFAVRDWLKSQGREAEEISFDKLKKNKPQ